MFYNRADGVVVVSDNCFKSHLAAGFVSSRFSQYLAVNVLFT